MDLKDAAEHVRKRVEQMQARSSVRLPLPVGEGRWGAEFGVLPPDKIEEWRMAIIQAATPEESARALAKYIADSCRCIVVEVDGGWQRVTEGTPPVPVRFGQSFAEELGMDFAADDGMEGVVLACWTLDDSSLSAEALEDFGNRLLAWSKDTTQKIRGELAGESQGGRLPSGQDGPPQTE